MRLLEQMGYRNVAHYGEGITGWRREGLPFDAGELRSIRPELRVSAEPAPVVP